MSVILNIETSSKNCSVCLSSKGNLVTSFDLEDEAYRHSELLTSSIQNILNENNLRSKKENSIKTSYNVLHKDGIPRSEDPNYDGGDHDLEERKNFLNIEYSFRNNKTINPYSFNLSLESGEDFKKGNLLCNYNFQLNENKKISSRFYAGIAKIDAYHYKYNIQMSAWNGFMDYSFSEKTFSREDDGNLSRQMFIREGGLKHYTDITSDNFLNELKFIDSDN